MAVAITEKQVMFIATKFGIRLSPTMDCWTHSLGHSDPMSLRLHLTKKNNGHQEHIWILPYRLEWGLDGSFLFCAYAHKTQANLRRVINEVFRLDQEGPAKIDSLCEQIQFVRGMVRRGAGGGGFIAPDPNPTFLESDIGSFSRE